MNKAGRIMVMALTVFFFTTLVSCSKNELDGNWEPMKWEAGYPGNPKSIVVPSEGGTYSLTCSNYHGPWLTQVTVDGSTIVISNEAGSFLHHVEHHWMIVDLTGNKLTIVVKPNNTGKDRKLRIGVSAGDVFDHIEVTQAK